MSDPTLTTTNRQTGLPRTDEFLKLQVLKAEEDLRKKSFPVISGKVIAEQHLAFWVAFFNHDYFRILRAEPMKVFSNLPTGKGRRDVTNSLDEIRRLRNRIFHHESICFTNGHAIDVNYPSSLKAKIVETLDWIDPEICLEFSDVHQVDAVLAQINSL